MPQRLPRLTVGVLGLISLAGAMPGCAGSGTPQPGTGTVENDLSIAAARLDEMLAASRPSAELPPHEQQSTTDRQVFPAPTDVITTPPVAAAGPPSEPDPASPPPEAASAMLPPPPTDAERRSRAVADLIELLGRQEGHTALDRAFGLALMDAVQPGSTGAALREAQDALDPDQRARVDALRDVLATFLDPGSGSPGALAAKLREHAAAMVARSPLTIPTAVLARRVTGFGRYTPFGGEAFLAGVAQPALVYVEVKGFQARPAAAAPAEALVIDAVVEPVATEPTWTIELTQELRLYHEADGVLAWHSPAAPVRDVSMRQRTDHYLVQRITLPATLTVGGYQLKVVVREPAAGAVAEATIPIRIVADPALTHTGPR